MKKLLCLLLAAVLMLTMFGCSTKQEKLRKPVPFYYRRAELSYAQSDSVIHAQLREGEDFDNLHTMLQIYLNGPTSDEYADTFPSGTQLISILFNGPVAELVLSSHLSNLNELDRNIACSCICMTVMALTEAESVRIRVEGGLTQQSYLFDMGNVDILLEDQAKTP